MRWPLVFLFLLVACSSITYTPNPSENPSGTSPVVPPIETPPSQDFPNIRRGWPVEYSSYVAALIPQTLLDVSASRMGGVCKNYGSLSDTEKRGVWAAILKSIAYPESAWDRGTYYVETSMGIDPFTGRTVASEGLLQLSYQDVTTYPSCKMKWSLDRQLSNSDINKTIFDARINLSCGVIIMNTLARAHSTENFFRFAGRYWSTTRSRADWPGRSASAYANGFDVFMAKLKATGACQ